MITKGSKVMIIGVGERAWFYNQRKEFYGITGIIQVIGEKFKGGVFDCNISLDKPTVHNLMFLGCADVKLKEVK